MSLQSRASRDLVLRTDRVEALFHPFDPSALSHRRVSDEADAYILGAVREFEDRSGITMRIQLPSGDSPCCDEVQQAFRQHFLQSAANCREALRAHFRDAFRSLGASLVFALFVVLLAQWIAGLADSRLLDKVAGGLSVAAWVILWRPTEMLVHDWRPLRRSLGLREDLAAMNVVCEPESSKDS